MFEIGEKVQWMVGDAIAMGEVSDVVSSGAVPGVSVRVEGPAAKIRVIRDDELTDDYVAIPLGGIDRVSTASSLRKKYSIHPPTDSELERINGMMPAGGKDRTAANTIVIPFVAADNLLSRSLDKWEIDSLKRMADLLPGLPAMLNHDWGDVGTVWGKVFDAHYEHTKTAPSGMLSASVDRKMNSRVIRDEGFAQVVAQVFSDSGSQVAKAVADGYIGKVSTGGFYFKDYRCPSCNTSFMDDSCPHYPPMRFQGEDIGGNPRMAPYSIRSGLSDMGELSVVSLPNLPNAGVI